VRGCEVRIRAAAVLRVRMVVERRTDPGGGGRGGGAVGGLASFSNVIDKVKFPLALAVGMAGTTLADRGNGCEGAWYYKGKGKGKVGG
jgi:hypothetical protein